MRKLIRVVTIVGGICCLVIKLFFQSVIVDEAGNHIPKKVKDYLAPSEDKKTNGSKEKKGLLLQLIEKMDINL